MTGLLLEKLPPLKMKAQVGIYGVMAVGILRLPVVRNQSHTMGNVPVLRTLVITLRHGPSDSNWFLYDDIT